MQSRVATVSSSFKMQTVKTVFALTVFVLIYLLLLFLSGLFLWGMVKLAWVIITIRFNLYFLAIGLGLVCMGAVIFYVLLKFLYFSNREDRSGLQEIFDEDHQELFALIRAVAKEVDTSEPKHVYLSVQVNASVFYDSSFWSMFIPIKKNLHIGLGLVNTVTRDEFKAILAHEFGHFSQRTMRVGSYVSVLNRMMYKMLFENEDFYKWTQDWAEFHFFVSWLVAAAVWIIRGVQWLLRLVYEWVYKTYMALSREMEFHADEIAAVVTGSDPLKQGLLRLPFAEAALNHAFQIYGVKNREKTRSANLLNNQFEVMLELAKHHSYPLQSELPALTMEDHGRYNKSLLYIKDQWSSHPTMEERIARLDQLNWKVELPEKGRANSYFRNIEGTQKALTDLVYSDQDWQDATVLSNSEFVKRWNESLVENIFPQVFNGYYDNRNFGVFDLEAAEAETGLVDRTELFSDIKLNLVYQANAIGNDIGLLQQVAQPKAVIKTFDYDGRRYKAKEANLLANELQNTLKGMEDELLANDRLIYRYCIGIEKRLQRPNKLRDCYKELFTEGEEWTRRMELAQSVHQAMAFTSYVNSYEVIYKSLDAAMHHEANLKKELRVLLDDTLLANEITKEMLEVVQKYLAKDLEYFNGSSYNEIALTILQQSISIFQYLTDRRYFLLKRSLLQVQAELYEQA